MSDDAGAERTPEREPGEADGRGAGADANGDGYVHDPDPGSRGGEPGGTRPHQAPPSESPFDWRGWLLVGVIVLCFLVVPASILYLPQAKGLIASLGLTLRDAYLVLPLVPAFLLGAVAVWAAVKSRA